MSDLLTEMRAQLADKDAEIKQLKRALEWFRKQVFGAKSEARAREAVSQDGQMNLGDQFEQPVVPPTDPPEEGTTVQGYRRSARREHDQADGDKLKFDDSVPRQIIEVPNPELAGIPASELELVDTRITYRLAQRKSNVVLEYHQKLFKRKDSQELVPRPSAPAAVIPGTCADVSFLANMVVDKFMFHLPLYRQHMRLEQAGIHLQRSTLTRWMHRIGFELEPIFQCLTSSILGSKMLSVDESPTPAGQGKGKMKQGYFWVLYGDQDEVAFIFSPSRSRKFLDVMLEGFTGTLMSDGYSAYSSFVAAHPELIHAQCWAHARRKFIECEDLAQASCKKIIGWIQMLYEVESVAKDPSTLARLRDQRSRSIIDQIFEFLRQEVANHAFTRSNPYVQAIGYALARENQLRTYLNDPTVPIDNNHVERSLRPAAVGRKNWLFHVTEDGARYAGICYSLIQSCLAAKVDPVTYFTDVLQRLPSHLGEDAWQLIPREWARRFAANPLRSDLATT